MLFLQIRGKCTSANDDTWYIWVMVFSTRNTVAFKTSPNKASFFFSSSVSSVIVTAPSDMFSLRWITLLSIRCSGKPSSNVRSVLIRCQGNWATIGAWAHVSRNWPLNAAAEFTNQWKAPKEWPSLCRQFRKKWRRFLHRKLCFLRSVWECKSVYSLFQAALTWFSD